MARASIKTLLPLDRFAQVVGVNPLHFNGVYLDNLEAQTCDQPMMQHTWQDSGRVGREAVAQAIADAEATLAQYLGYPVAPQWIREEQIRWPRGIAEATRLNEDLRSRPMAVQLANGFLHYGGRETFSLIQADAAVAYDDLDGDLYAESARITVATSVIDPEEISLRYAGRDDTYEIRPITVVIGDGNAVIRCRREQLVKLALQEALQANGVDGSNDDNFETVVDVYRRYNDPDEAVSFEWDETDCNTLTTTVTTGTLIVRDGRLGSAAPRVITTIGRLPDRAYAWYRAGWRDTASPRSFTSMDPRWERAIAYLVLASVNKPMCACQQLEAQSNYWREDLAFGGGDTGSFRLGRMLDCPLGTTRAAIYAWRLVQQYRLGQNA
jgi:hypothetical protein